MTEEGQSLASFVIMANEKAIEWEDTALKGVKQKVFRSCSGYRWVCTFGQDWRGSEGSATYTFNIPPYLRHIRRIGSWRKEDGVWNVCVYPSWISTWRIHSNKGNYCLWGIWSSLFYTTRGVITLNLPFSFLHPIRSIDKWERQRHTGLRKACKPTSLRPNRLRFVSKILAILLLWRFLE